ncbi:MAG: cytochrome c [Candidatus Acidiferrum sp.]
MNGLRRKRNLLVFGWTGLAVFTAALTLDLVVSRATSAAARQDIAWTVPTGAKAVKNPVRVTPEGLKEAGEMFQQVCSSCHGPKGAGDGPAANALKPKPANFTDARRMNRETDGALFWKISNGRGPMPSWQQIPEKQRWELVNYLRTLASKGNSPRRSDSAAK